MAEATADPVLELDAGGNPIGGGPGAMVEVLPQAVPQDLEDAAFGAVEQAPPLPPPFPPE